MVKIGGFGSENCIVQVRSGRVVTMHQPPSEVMLCTHGPSPMGPKTYSYLLFLLKCGSVDTVSRCAESI